MFKATYIDMNHLSTEASTGLRGCLCSWYTLITLSWSTDVSHKPMLPCISLYNKHFARMFKFSADGSAYYGNRPTLNAGAGLAHTMERDTSSPQT